MTDPRSIPYKSLRWVADYLDANRLSQSAQAVRDTARKLKEQEREIKSLNDKIAQLTLDVSDAHDEGYGEGFEDGHDHSLRLT